jgi:tetratricopeptide (TPR) repeat protein
MRFVRGDSLKEAIEHFHGGTGPTRARTRGLELRRLLRRFLDVCNAIEYAHSRGVLHRDIKPGNVIVGMHGETLVVDWGLAKPLGRVDSGHDSGERALMPSSASGSAETLPGSALGTPAYMSPEQARGDLDALGPATDVYSLGATLYSLLTGKAPFDGDVGEVLRKVQRGDFPPPRQLDPSIDRALEAVCLKAMATKPENRYASGKALADDVERWAADEPVAAYREPWTHTAVRWISRHRTGVTGATAALLASAIGLAVVAGVQARANFALEQAKLATDQALTAALTEKKAKEDALALSEESRKQAQAVSAFLVESFRSPDPSQDGRLVKVADLLDRAAARLDTGFTGSRSMRGTLLEALGRTYYGLGLYENAVSMSTKAHAEREAAFGSDHPDTLTSRHSLAKAYLAVGRTAEAIALDEVTLRLRESRLGTDHPDTLWSRQSLAADYVRAGRTAEAIALVEQTLRSQELIMGADHPDTLSTRNDLAAAYGAAGRTAEAIALASKALKLQESRLGPDHPATLNSRILLAQEHIRAGHTAEAIALFKATLKLSESRLGSDHPITLTARGNLAAGYWAAGRITEANALQEVILKLCESRLGPDHPDTLNSRNNLVTGYLKVGRAEDAIRLQEETVRRGESKLGADHPSTLRSRLSLAMAYKAIGRARRDAGRRQEAIDEYRLAVAIQEKLAEGHPEIPMYRDILAWVLVDFGMCLREMALPDQSERCLERSLEIWLRRMAEESAVGEQRGGNLLWTLDEMRQLARGTGRVAPALAGYRRAIEASDKLLGASPKDRSSRDLVAALYAGFGKLLVDCHQPREAKRAFERAVGIRQALAGEEPDQTRHRGQMGSIRRWLGWALFDLGETTRAVEEWRRAISLVEGFTARSGDELYDLACCHAALSRVAKPNGLSQPVVQGPAEGDMVIGLLRQAAAAGYHDLVCLRTDRDLDSLRSRPTFQLLLMDLAFPDQPFAPTD